MPAKAKPAATKVAAVAMASDDGHFSWASEDSGSGGLSLDDEADSVSLHGADDDRESWGGGDASLSCDGEDDDGSSWSLPRDGGEEESPSATAHHPSGDRLSGDRHSGDRPSGDRPSDGESVWNCSGESPSDGESVWSGEASENQNDSITSREGKGMGCKRRRVSDIVRIKTFATCFSWATSLWSTMAGILGDRLLYHRLCCRKNTLGSYFSGLGTLEVALDMVAAVAPSAIRATCSFASEYACDKSVGSQRVLCQRTSCCVYVDILHRISGSLKNCRADALGFEDLRALVSAASAIDAAHCARHDRECKWPGRVAVDVSGSPCRPWSRAAKVGKRGLRHKDIILFLAWCVVMRCTRPFIAIHENVLGFDKSLLLKLLGEWYDIIVLRVDPADAGFAFIRRPRYYFVLTLRGAVAAGNLQEMYDHVCSKLHYDVSEWPSWVWRASENELLDEENRARNHAKLEPLDSPSSDWSYILSDKQRGGLEAAEAAWAQKYSIAARDDPACVLDVSQSASRINLHRGELPTLRTASERIWSPMRKRWLTFKERLACMGYPVYEDLALAARVPLDTISPTAPRFCPGNAMHVANLGIVVTVVLAGCHFDSPL